MPKLPGGPIARRQLHFIFIADCSASMAGEKIHALNNAIRESIPHMRKAADGEPNAEVVVKAVKFSSGATWHVSKATPVRDFEWIDLSADGQTDMGRALGLVTDALKTPPMPENGLPPLLVLISDGQPTDDFNAGLKALMSEPWGKKSVRISIAIGSDADRSVLQKFIGDPERTPLDAKNAPDLVACIKWASTVALRVVSSPKSSPQGAPNSGSVSLPPSPMPSANIDDVW